ncbi:hypothetical protein BH10BAC3_BH10BAC3_29720 [soil metagenome]
MKKGSQLLIIFLLSATAATTAQTLGTYPDATVTSGQNTTISPSVAPANLSGIVAYANTNFTGLLTVNLTSGVVTVTDAKQAGMYLVTVKAFNGAAATTTTFTLTVTNPDCSLGLFSAAPDASVGTNPYGVAIGDFNGMAIRTLLRLIMAQTPYRSGWATAWAAFPARLMCMLGLLPGSWQLETLTAMVKRILLLLTIIQLRYRSGWATVRVALQAPLKCLLGQIPGLLRLGILTTTGCRILW